MHPTVFAVLQYLTPQHTLSRVIGAFAACRFGPFKNAVIKAFIRRYQVDMSLAENENPESYACFNDFFTRPLKPHVRPLCQLPNSIACPADGAISQVGRIQDGRIFQAKGRDYSLVELLGGEAQLAQPFHNGQFATIYLSPKDYHRVHMPASGELTRTTYIPGDLFSVNQVTAEHVPRVFARNERLVCHFTTAHGPMVVVLVGAMIVAGIATPWAGVVAPVRKQVRATEYGRAHCVNLAKGDEMGRFFLGSTAIVLLPEGAAEWDVHLSAGMPVQMGQAIGQWATKG